MSYRYNKGYPAPISYPIPASGLPMITGSKLHAPIPGEAHDSPVPSMPGTEHYQCELTELLIVRAEVEKGKWPTEFLKRHHPRNTFNATIIPEPLKLGGLNHLDPKFAASMVHKDLPTDLAHWCYKYVRAQNAPLKTKENPHTSFLQFAPNMLCDIGNKVEENFLKTWQVKWFYGRPRPEEATSQCDSTTNITSYPEGCPFHPSYPAGHAAGAAAVTVLFDNYTLTQQQYDNIYDAAYMFAMFRTFSGVHFASDNIEGLKLSGFPIAHVHTW